MFNFLKFIFIFTCALICQVCSAIDFVSEPNFKEIVNKQVMCDSLEWINPDDISTTLPMTYTWVREGSAGYGSHGFKAPGITTTGLHTCTGLTAITKTNYPALAHITDLTSPESAITFLEHIDVDFKKPITLISKTLNDTHLLPIKWAIEDKFHESVLHIHIKTLPIFKFKGKVSTCLSETNYQSIGRDLRGISFSFNSSGHHNFFYMDTKLQGKMTDLLDCYNPPESDFDTLYVHKLPY